MSVETLPDGERIIQKALREHEDMEEFGARVSSVVPRDFAQPWVRATVIDVADSAISQVEHLLTWAIQFDCFAGDEAMRTFVGPDEAWRLGYLTRALLKGLEGTSVEDLVITKVRFPNMARVPDTSSKPPRERIVLDAEITGHAE